VLALALLALGVAGGYQLATASSLLPTVAASAGDADRKVLYWYDPMVPTQKFDQPGKSPFMDMQLVPRYADEAQAGGVSVSPQAQQSLGLRLATVEQRSIASSIEVLGTVQLNERDISIVQARASGFVERVYPLAPGDVVTCRRAAGGAAAARVGGRAARIPGGEGAAGRDLAPGGPAAAAAAGHDRPCHRAGGAQRRRAGPHHGTPAAGRPAGRTDGAGPA
jgi:hypothetical protein